MEITKVLHYVFLVLGLVTFFVAIKPGEKLKKYKNVFWIFGNVFFVASFAVDYVVEEDINYGAIAMLLIANYLLASQGNKKLEEK